jgi:hypothetical protein
LISVLLEAGARHSLQFPTRQKSPDEDGSQKSVTNVDRNASGSSCPINKGVVVIAIKRVFGHPQSSSSFVLGRFLRRVGQRSEPKPITCSIQSLPSGQTLPEARTTTTTTIGEFQGTQQEKRKSLWLSTPGRPNKQATDKFSPLSGYFLVIRIKYGINIPYGKSISWQLVFLTVSNDRSSPVQ